MYTAVWKMATEKENNDEKRFIEDSDVTRLNLDASEIVPPYISRQSSQTVTQTSGSPVKSLSSSSQASTTSSNAAAVAYMQKVPEYVTGERSMSSPEKLTQATLHKPNIVPVNVGPNVHKDDPPVTTVPGTSQRGSISVDKSVPWSGHSILKVPSCRDIQASHQNKQCLKDPKVVQTLQQPYLTSFTANVSTDNEPLNLTVGHRPTEKVIGSSLVAAVSKERTSVKISESLNVGKVTSTSSKSSNYKVAHPIGSRKVTENIITYHEPMFQSVANTLFENQKNLLMGKRKAEDDKSKGESGSKDFKRSRLDPAHSPCKVLDGKTIVKKKCTIENIIERIRTEKTVSRGGNGQVAKQNEAEKEKAKNGKDEKSDNTSYEKTNTSYERTKESASENKSQEKEKPDSAINTLKSKNHEHSEEWDVPTEIKLEKDKEIDTQETNTITVKKNDTIDNCDSVSTKVNVESTVSKQISPKTDLFKQKKSSVTPTKEKKELKPPKEKAAKSPSPKKVNVDQTSPKKVKVEKSSPKQKKLKEDSFKESSVLASACTENMKTENKEKKNTAKNVLKAKKKTGDKDKLDIKVKKFTKMKGVKGEKITKQDNIQNDSDTDAYENGDIEIKKTIGEKVKVKRNNQNTLKKSSDGPKKPGRKKKSENENCIKKDIKKKSETETKQEDEKLDKIKTKVTKPRKQKLPIACRRIKREASLNAAMFLNILNEKSPRVSKFGSQRSKSDSEIKNVQVESVYSCHSMTEVGINENISKSDTFKKEFKSPKKEKMSPIKNMNGDSLKLGNVLVKDSATPRIEPKSPKKARSPKRKVSFSDTVFEEVFEAVIQRSIDATETLQPPVKKKRGRKSLKETKMKETKRKKEDCVKLKTKKNIVDVKQKKKKKFRLRKIKQAIKMSASKSPEEAEEKKRKANLARLERAKELMKTERKVSEKNAVEEKDSDDSVYESSEKEGNKSTDQTESGGKPDEIKKVKAKKGALCRAARTHVSVESKTVVENTMPSPRWCECCQSSYYPYQQTQGTQVWRIKHLVDKDSTISPEPIQSSSNHFIAAHARCEVRPYASPSHVSVIDSSPYVGQIVPHGHIQCSACSCGHSGVFHPGQCQNCTLGGVGNMLPCQRYGSTYSVTYPHTHGSYTHCGCGACYPASSYHHSVGQTLIHQPQMSMSAESSILLHHTVPLQVTHETTHPVSLPAMTHSHNESSLSHPVQPVPLQLNHSEQNLNSLTHMCQLSQGEVTNVSVMASSSPCDHEVDVGSRDDIVKLVPNISQSLTTAKLTDPVSTSVKTKKIKLKEPSFKRKKSETCDSKGKDISGDINTKKRKKNADEEQAKKFKLKECKVKLKDKKSSSLLLIKQKQKQLEQKSLKLSYKKDTTENIIGGKKVRVKSAETKVARKVKKSASSEMKKEEKEQPKRAWHGWSWEDEGVVKKVVNIFDGQTVERRCFGAIHHDDGDTIQVKDCVLVRSGQKEKDIPYVAKVSNFWEDPLNGEMMMSVLWFYRPEHAEGGPILGSLENEVFAAKHRDEILVACIEDRGYVLTVNEYCRFMAEVERTKSHLPPRNKVVPEPEEVYPSNRIPPVDINPENVFLCRQVYDIKLKRVLKNPS